MTTTSIIIANSPINDGNRGCVALTLSSIYIIDKIFKDRNKKYKLYILDSYIKKRKAQKICVGDRTIEYQPISYPYEIGLKLIAKSIINFTEIIKSIFIFHNSDYILDLGKGDSFADIYGKKRFYTTDRIHKLARFFSKPYIFLPQTIGPFSDNKILEKAKCSISKAMIVMARDRESLEFVQNNIPLQTNVKEYIDVAFFLPFTNVQFDQSFIHVGLNVSSLLWRGGYTGDNQFGLKEDYPKVISAIVNYFLSMPNVILHLVPHVVGKDGKEAADTIVSKKIVESCDNPRITIAPYFESPVDAKGYISGLDFFLGARMHSTIAAFSSGVPVIPMAYSRKFNGLFLQTLNYEYMVDLKTSDLNEIIDFVSQSFNQRSKIKSLIKERQTIVRKKEQDIFDTLSEIFDLV